MKPFVLHGKHLDWSASSFALGTHKFGGNGLPDAQCFALMDYYMENGGNVLDTAAVYGKEGCQPSGTSYSELCIGKWLRQNNCRDQLLLITKGAHPCAENGIKRHRVTQQDIADDLAQSLEHLQTDHIDLYFLHRDNPALPAGQIMEWLNPHVQNGTIRALGASNWTTARIDEANAYARAHGLAEFEASEIAFSLRKDALDWNDGSAVEMSPEEYAGYLRNQIPVFAYNSQSSGFFYTNFNTPDSQIPDTPENIARLNRVRTLCRQTGRTPHEVIFGYLNAQRITVLPIAAASSAARLKEMFDGANAMLTQAEIAYLDGWQPA